MILFATVSYVAALVWMFRSTPHPSAGPQRAGVLASLNMVADALQLLPAARATTQRWSATEWSTTRRGWLFFTSTPETRARLVPLSIIGTRRVGGSAPRGVARL
jgi:hypothetical protein